MELKGKTALVTGGAKRIGRAIVLSLAARGVKVAVHYRVSGVEAEKTAAEAKALGVESMVVRAELSDETQVARIFKEVGERLGGPDILVNNAAIFERTPVLDVTTDQWNRTIDSNLTGPWLCSIHASRILAGREGAIISIADSSAGDPYPNHLPYSISKAGVVAMTSGLAKALGPKVRVGALAFSYALPSASAKAEEGVVFPAGQRITPNEVADAVVRMAEGSLGANGETVSL